MRACRSARALVVVVVAGLDASCGHGAVSNPDDGGNVDGAVDLTDGPRSVAGAPRVDSGPVVDADIPRGDVRITGITFDSTSLRRFDNGTDIWPVTWADDNNLYVAGGDGNGFDGVDTRGMDLSRITGSPDTYMGTELFAKTDVLPKGLLAVDGGLYVVEQARTTSDKARFGVSWNHGLTWSYNGNGSTDWDYAEPDGAFKSAAFINHGQDYQDGPSDVYVASTDDKNANGYYNSLVLFRVPRNAIMDRGQHQYFAGLDSNGNPTWTSDLGARQPIFTRTGEIHWGAAVHFNPVLRRYLLAFFINTSADLAVYEGPAPWGPWTFVAERRIVDSVRKFTMNFVNKNDGVDNWLSSDGLHWWCIVSGLTAWDSFNLLRADLTVAPL